MKGSLYFPCRFRHKTGGIREIVPNEIMRICVLCQIIASQEAASYRLGYLIPLSTSSATPMPPINIKNSIRIKLLSL